jgi:hypothetical protein
MQGQTDSTTATIQVHPTGGSRRYWRKIYGRDFCEPSVTVNFLPCVGRRPALQFSQGIVALKFG